MAPYVTRQEIHPLQGSDPCLFAHFLEARFWIASLLLTIRDVWSIAVSQAVANPPRTSQPLPFGPLFVV